MSSWTYEEKFLIKKLWCCNSIRKKILDLSLPMILADDIEKKNVMEEKDLRKTKKLSIEHLWRELSHLYTAVAPDKRTSAVSNVPLFAAQHLMDGFCIELLDGDSNMYVVSKYYIFI